MDWSDTGILLTLRRHGESAAIIEVFTAQHGRHAGVVQGGASRKFAPFLQPGAQLALTWRARLEDHIGTFSVEPMKSRAAGLMSDAARLSGFGALSSLLMLCLPEREAHEALYQTTIALADRLSDAEDWVEAYIAWEVQLLQEVGFGLDLNQCAVTGNTEDLAYVSPRSGRAVSRAAAGKWADKLLPLPPLLRGKQVETYQDISQAFETTGYFLQHRVFPALGHQNLPEARARLLSALRRRFE